VKSKIVTGCAKEKIASKPFPESQTRAKELFELIHLDLKTFPVLLYHKYKDFIIFIDDKSTAYWIKCL
jgi:hypothetical protein